MQICYAICWSIISELKVFKIHDICISKQRILSPKLSREKFIRQCILKKSVKEPPHLDYYKLLNEFNHIGNNLNQIAKSLNSRQDNSSFLVEVTIEELRNMIKNLDEKVRGD